MPRKTLVRLTHEQIGEIERCFKSPEYFLDNYCWLEEKETRSILPFKPFRFQRRVFRWLHAGDNVCALKSRRVGISWVVAAYAAWLINFNDGVNVLLLSKNEKDAISLLAKVKFILKNLARRNTDDYHGAEKCPWLRGEIFTDNQRNFSVAYRDNEGNIQSESTVSSLTTTTESGRSEGATLIFCDEFAFVKPDDEATWTAIRPTTARGGQWVMGSTPNGVGGVFHRHCLIGKAKKNVGFKYVEVHWTEAGITQEQFDEFTEGMTEAAIAQEWELDFAQSGDPVFNALDLAVCYKPLNEFPDVGRYLREYAKKVRERTSATILDAPIYYSGVDSAEGKVGRKASQKDFNAFVPVTLDGVQATCYSSKESLGDWAGKTIDTPHGKAEVPGRVTKLHRAYPGIVYIENNGPGHTVVNRHQLPDGPENEMYESQTTQKFKGKIINNLILAVEGHQITITDPFTYECMIVFQKGSMPGTFSAPPGYNDDPVIALALAWYAMISFGAMNFEWNSDLSRMRRATPEDAFNEMRGEPPMAVHKDNQRMSEMIGQSHGGEFGISDDFDISLIPDPEADFMPLTQGEPQ